jgi:DNA-directed RNA polymerase subunit RPC12/RpoP
MNTFKFTCPDCGQKISINADSKGRRMDCPSCSAKIVVPPPPINKDVVPVATREATPTKPAGSAPATPKPAPTAPKTGLKAAPKSATPASVKPAASPVLKPAPKPVPTVKIPATTEAKSAPKLPAAVKPQVAPVPAPAPAPVPVTAVKAAPKAAPTVAAKPVPSAKPVAEPVPQPTAKRVPTVKIPTMTEAKSAPKLPAAVKPQVAPVPAPAPAPVPATAVKAPPKAAATVAAKPVAEPVPQPASKPVPTVKIPATTKAKSAPKLEAGMEPRVAVMTPEIKLEVVRAVRSRIADSAQWMPGKGEQGEYYYAAKSSGGQWVTVPADDPDATRFSLFGAVLRELGERNVVRATKGRLQFLDEELTDAIRQVLGREPEQAPLSEAERGELTHEQCLAALERLEQHYRREAEDAHLVESRSKVEEIRLPDLLQTMEQQSVLRAEDVACALYHEVEELKRQIARLETGLAQALKPRTAKEQTSRE